jgi:hypothetical protein
MENLLGLALFFWLDARPDPVNPLPWGALLVLLAMVFCLAVLFVAALVFLLIWVKRRNAGSA